MIRRLILFSCVLLNFSIISNKALAQYAIGGTAGPALYNAVYWLTWDENATNTTLITAPQGADKDHIINGTYTWQLSPSVRITAILSNEVFVNGDKMISYTPGNFSGDGLDLIYSGNNLPKPASRGVANSGLATINGETITFDIDLTVSVLINGVYINVAYPGMIIADAESLNAGDEFISGTSTNAVAFQLLNKRTEGNANDSHYKLQLTDSGRSFKLFVDQPPGDVGVQAVLFAKGATSLKDVKIEGQGLTAVAIGLILPFDFGDAPATFGAPAHYIDDFQTQDYFTTDGTYAVVEYNISPLIPKASVYIGAGNVDADGQPKFSTGANADDTTANNDENTLNVSSLPDIRVNQSGDITLSVPVTNTKQIAATLYAWIDFNGDGIFETYEGTSLPVPQNTNNQSVNLIFKGASFSKLLRAGALYGRLRITTSALTDDGVSQVDERSINFAADGEVEDYRFKDVLGSGVGISGHIYDDGNGGSDNLISGNKISVVSGQQLYAYLADSTLKIINKIPVDTAGFYHFDDVVSGNYSVGISVLNALVGATLSSTTPALPKPWVPSADGYGINNGNRNGIEPGIPDLKIVVTMPGNGKGVTDVDFGVDQRPIAVADHDTTKINQPVTINVARNDSDADGSLELSAILLVDPADKISKSTITIPAQGSYTSTKAGTVVFTPTATFIGKATPVAYTITDNYGAVSLPALIYVAVKPVGVKDTASTRVNVPINIVVKNNDGPSGNGTSVTAGNGSHGTTVTGTTGAVTYTPNPGFTGTDTFTYTLTTADTTASDPITVTIRVFADSAALSLTKVALNTGSKAGDVINYQLVAKNTGNVLLTNIGIKDDRADAGSISPAVIASLAAGASVNLIAKHTLTQEEVNRGTFANQASASGTDPSGTPVNQPKSDDPTTPAPNDSTRVTIVAMPGLAVVKTGVFAINKITYTFLVTNTGNVTLTNLNLTDAKLNLRNVVLTLPVGGLQPAASVNFTASYTVLQADKVVGSVTNTANATGTPPAGTPVTGTGTTTTPVGRLPTAIDDVAQTDANKAVIISVLANDDAAGSTFNIPTLLITTQPQNGIATKNNDGSVTYTPNKGFTGQDVFNYRVTDVLGYTTNIATVTITVNFIGIINIPNLFTPNGDGRNDVFEIRGLEQYAANHLTIVNRWGNEVYKQDSYRNNWPGDGLNEGTYFYILQVKKTAADSWQVFKGYVTLLRTVNR
ncbi:CshA/CshB family fibrillar adhesin-related protein [Mucilaginibacter ginkgonis]|uniref:Tandem-95 repeat protein n=1 Tax=Mucilaginibacter ginkgonis TaxID=2682091 RepID=A0A6I4IMX9_9SPHI|nr:CshA/CshB family fibrillar adhesin-related protein [Mucilaginibacter ginkgonis]QQL51227.1 tandem-95 repeat protein [Mucilaginibacter ginkgonis]